MFLMSRYRAVLLGGLCHVLGCHSAFTVSGPPEVTPSRTAFRLPERSAPDQERLSHTPANVTQDLGEILAGRIARHTFSFANHANSTLRLLGDSAIRKSCGCTQVEVAEYQLMPEQATSVQLSLDTTNRQGPFSEQATLTWTNDDGTVFPVTYGLSGVVRPLLASDPQELYFSQDDVIHARDQTIRFLGSSLVDLTRLEWHTVGDFVEASRRQTSVPEEPIFSIRCRPGGTGSPRRGALVIRAPFHHSRDDDGSVESTSFAEHSITILAEDPTELHVAPARLVFVRQEGDTEWQASAVLSGMKITPSTQVARCELNSLRLQHTEKRISPTLLHLNLRLPAAPPHLNETTPIRITLSTGVSRVVPAVFLNSQP